MGQPPSSVDICPGNIETLVRTEDAESGPASRRQAGPEETVDDDGPLKSHDRGSGNLTRLDGSSPIYHVNLTFTTELPRPPTSEQYDPRQPNHDEPLPPCPNLAAFASPSDWSAARKSLILILSCTATFLTAFTAGAYSPPASIMAADFHSTRLVLLIGITTFCLGFAFAPMLLAPLSEIMGRRPIFIAAGIVFVIFQALCSVMPDVAGMLISRFFNGVGASVFSTVVGGVLADIWANHERNTPMALFAGSALAGTGAGPLVSSALIQTLGPTSLAWKWSFWMQVIMDASLVLALLFFFSESRRSVILGNKAKALNGWYEQLEARGVYGLCLGRELAAMASSASSRPASVATHSSDDDGDGDGDEEKTIERPTTPIVKRIRWVVQEEQQRASLAHIIGTSVRRPFYLLFTEPVVFCFSLWAAFSWGVLYLSFSVVPYLYGDNFDLSSRVYVAIMIASAVATCVSICQEKILRHPQWRRHDDDYQGFQYSDSRFWAMLRARFPAEAPESRLYFSCFTSLLFPTGLFVALLSDPNTHGYLQSVGLGLATWGIYAIYLTTFNYLADSYHVYASSALAAQGLCRNVVGGAFPLITSICFQNLGTRGAGALLGSIAAALSLIPWVLIFFGERIRMRSKFALSLEKS